MITYQSLRLILFFGLYPRPIFSTTDDAVVKSLTVDIQGQEVDSTLIVMVKQQEKTAANIRNLLEDCVLTHANAAST